MLTISLLSRGREFESHPSHLYERVAQSVEHEYQKGDLRKSLAATLMIWDANLGVVGSSPTSLI